MVQDRTLQRSRAKIVFERQLKWWLWMLLAKRSNHIFSGSRKVLFAVWWLVNQREPSHALASVHFHWAPRGGS